MNNNEYNINDNKKFAININKDIHVKISKTILRKEAARDWSRLPNDYRLSN